jgi:hypothetical protein
VLGFEPEGQDESVIDGRTTKVTVGPIEVPDATGTAHLNFSDQDQFAGFYTTLLETETGIPRLGVIYANCTQIEQEPSDPIEPEDPASNTTVTEPELPQEEGL